MAGTGSSRTASVRMLEIEDWLYCRAIGALLRRKRRDRRIGQEEVGAHLGISQSAYCRVEIGETELTVVHLRKLSKFLGFEPVALLNQAERSLERAHKTADAIGMHAWRDAVRRGDRRALSGLLDFATRL